MIVVDSALERRAKEGRPVRVGIVGAGAMGRGIARQILLSVPGLRVAAIANRTVDRATQTYLHAEVDRVEVAHSAEEVETAVADQRPVVTADAFALCGAPSIDVVLEVTGAVDFGARVGDSKSQTPIRMVTSPASS
jgi:predicted homoserine dehydrogenase-like protein